MGLAKGQRGAKKQAEKAAAAAQDVDSGPDRLPGAAFTESQLKPLAAAAVTALVLSFVLAGGPSRVLHAADVHGGADRVLPYTARLRATIHRLFREGRGTRDLCGAGGLTTEQFIDAVAEALPEETNT